MDAEERHLQRLAETGDVLAGLRLHEARKRRGDELLPTHWMFRVTWHRYSYLIAGEAWIQLELRVVKWKHGPTCTYGHIVGIAPTVTMTQEEFNRRYHGSR